MVGRRSVVNVSGSSSRQPSSGSWSSKLKVVSTTCSVVRCTSNATAGAHVKHSNTGTSDKQYIVRLCASHNHHSNKDVMVLKKNTCMARATKN